MTERFQRLFAIFTAARRLEGHERIAYLDRACGGDAALRAEVEGLLAAHAEPLAAEALAPGLGAATRTAWADATVDEATPPQGLGPFRIVRRIAAGGMGTVYEAAQDEAPRRLALKVVRPEAGTPEGLRRFAREADILARLQHPGIARIHRVGSAPSPSGEVHYIAMELVVGRPLHEAAAPLQTPERLELLARVCDAVAYAHQHGVIHRDLKPSNILVTADGQPKVLDFGVARLAGGETSLLTRTGLVIGTLAYMSPEQAAGDGDRVDTRSDVYALGVLGYEMACGRLPYDLAGLALPAAVRKVLDEEPVPPGELDRALRNDPTVILLKALAKEPERRYQSAAELAEDLRRYLRDEPILARPTTASYHFRRFLRRHRAGVIAAAGILLSLVAGLVLALRSAEEERRQRGRADVNAARAQRASALAALEAAVAHLRNEDPAAAEASLGRVPPVARGWEWRYVAARLDTSVAHAPFPEAVARCVVAPGAREAAGLTAKGRLYRLDPATGRTVDAGATAPLAVLAYGGERLLVAQREDGKVAFRAAGTESPLPGSGRFELEPSALAAAEAGDRLAVAFRITQYRHSPIYVVDPRSGEQLGHIGGDMTETYALAFDPAGARLAAGGPDMLLKVLDGRSAQLLHRLPGHTGSIRAVGFSPDGRWLASAGDDKTIRLWDAATGEERHRLLGHTGAVLSLDFAPDGRSLASGASDGTVRVWSATTGECTQVLLGHRAPVGAVGFGREGRAVVAVSAEGARRWPMPSGGEAAVLRFHGTEPYPYVYGVAFDARGERLYSAGWDGAVRIVDPSTHRQLRALEIPGEKMYGMAVSPDGTRVAAGREATHLWDTSSGRLLARAQGTVATLAFDPGGRWLYVGDASGVVRRVSAETLEEQTTWRTHGNEVLDAAVGPGGSLLATVSRDGGCVVRRTDDGTEAHRLYAHHGGAFGVAFHPGGRLMATAGADRTIALWDPATGREVTRLSGHKDNVYALAFSPDGTRLASGSNDTTIRIWDVDARETRLELRGHAHYVYRLAFSPDGTLLASASGDSSVRIWSTTPERERAREAEAILAAEEALRVGDPAALAAVAADPARPPAERRAARNLQLLETR